MNLGGTMEERDPYIFGSVERQQTLMHYESLITVWVAKNNP